MNFGIICNKKLPKPRALLCILIVSILQLSQPILATNEDSASGVGVKQWAEGSQVLRLRHRLDRPDDGYCVDVIGLGLDARTDLPLFAHNCSSERNPDEAVRFDNAGLIHFPAYKLCVTVMGINGQSLPGSAVLLRPCGESSAFMDAKALQRFSLHPNGRLSLGSTNLCLTVGPRSAPTYSTQHRWRALYADDCAAVPQERNRWEFTTIETSR